MYGWLVLAAGYERTENALFATPQVASLDSGKILVNPDTRGLIVEIGCSDRNTTDDELLPEYPDAFLVAFEPMLDKYAVLLSRGAKRLPGRPVDQPIGRHHPRGLVLPLAVSLSGGHVPMHISKTAGCSSLLKTNENTKWGRFCLKQLEKRVIESITMAGLASLLPDNLPIYYFNIWLHGAVQKISKVNAISVRVIHS